MFLLILQLNAAIYFSSSIYFCNADYITLFIPDGFFTCKGGEMVTGSHYDNYKTTTQTVFRFQAVSDANVRRALEIVHLSDQIRSIQSTYKGSYDVHTCVYSEVHSAFHLYRH